MSPSNESVPVRRLRAGLVTAVLVSLLAAGPGRQAHAGDAAASTAPAKSRSKAESKSAGRSADKDSVQGNVEQLGREVSDPSVLDRIKAHEQELEKKVQHKRASQRQDHGEARPADAVDLAKSLDKPGGAPDAPVKSDDKSGAKKKAGATPPPPAATKAPAPTR
jgi:hypothetical protein